MLQGTMSTGALAMTASTALSILKIIAAANQRVTLDRLDIASNSITPTDGGVLVEIMRYSSGGTFTALSPVPIDSTNDETMTTTGGKNVSAEPTLGAVLWNGYYPAQNGLILPLEPRIEIPGGTSIVVRVTPAGLAATTKVAATGFISE